MANYYHDNNQRKSYKRWRRLRRGLLVMLLLILVIAIAGGIYIWQNSTSNNQPVVIKKPTSSYYAGAPKRVFQTDQFKFVSTSNWGLSQEESLPPYKYVFFTHSLNNNLIDFEFDVIINKSQAGQAVNYVMPVTVVKDSQLKTDILSSRCGDELVSNNPKAAPNTMAMVFHGAKYVCAVRGSTEKAAAALVGGEYDITLKRPEGQTAVINFFFSNNSSSAFGQTFKEVLESFTLK